MRQYEEKKKKAMKNLRYYLMFCSIFTIFNISLIVLLDSYMFPKNFFAIWPIIGWGVPTVLRFFELKRYKNGQ